MISGGRGITWHYGGHFFDIAVSGLRARRRNSEDHKRALLSSNLQSSSNDPPKTREVADKMVRRQHGHERIAPAFLQQMHGGQANGRRRIPAGRLDQRGPRS